MKDKTEGTKTETQLRLRSGVPLEKLTVSQPVKKLPAFYGTRRFITVKHRSDYTNHMYDIYLLHIFTMLLLHVSAYHTPIFGENSRDLLKTTCCCAATIYGWRN
jgi:hypothetical protein